MVGEDNERDPSRAGKMYIEFIPREECPVVGNYLIRPMRKLRVWDKDGNLTRKLG